MIQIVRREEKEKCRATLQRIAERSIALDTELMNSVGEIVNGVRRHGDAALIEYTRRFDGVELTRAELRVDAASIKSFAAEVDVDVLAALREAIRRISRFHEHERRKSWEMPNTVPGVRLGQRVSALSSAGLYVPGGTASYPSSVVMNVVPAQIAGVKRLAVITPPHTLKENPAVAAALFELGIEEVYQVGGAQAIAALAYGTETIRAVDKITGPGNKYVAAAKKLVFGKVGIDSIAGPSEVVIIADETASSAFIAADLLAQAEHDADASAILVTTSEQLACDVQREVARQAATLPRRTIVERSLRDYGSIIVVADMEEACRLVDDLAPEHLEIIAADEERISNRINHAGAIFLGAYTPEAVGDYFAGPNHVLPTGGAARFSSALGVNDFLRHTSIMRYSADELNKTARMIANLAHAEGLDAHARSALIRLEEEHVQAEGEMTSEEFQHAASGSSSA